MIQEVYLIDNDDKIKDKLVKMFEKEEDYKFKKAKTHEIDTVLRNIPALIIINEDNIDEDIIKLCNDIRNNPIVYINLEELVYLIESQQEAIVFISTSDCPYCRASIESLLKAAKDLNIDTIYYYDISNNQEDDEELKNKIIDKKIANKNDNGSLRWTIPQVLKFKNGKLISSATGMMYELQNNQTKYDELSENQKNNIYSIYYIVLSKNEGEVD